MLREIPGDELSVFSDAALTEQALAMTQVHKASAARPGSGRAAAGYRRAAELVAKAIGYLRRFEVEARRRAGGGR